MTLALAYLYVPVYFDLQLTSAYEVNWPLKIVFFILLKFKFLI